MTAAPFIVVDGSSWLYRAFHALPRLTAPDGQPTGAVYGMGNMLRKLLREFEPEHIAVVFDPRGKTFRHERYPEYKANRPPVPPELSEQFEPLCQLIDSLGLPRLQMDGVEADDVIATLAHQARADGRETLIVSGDKDLAQLVGPGVEMLDTMKDKRLDAAAVAEKFGVGPALIIDWLALTGDSSDNVPGIPGVGPKTATKWLHEFGSLDALVARADEVGGKAGERLREHLDQLALSRELVTVRDDLDLQQHWQDLQRQGLDQEAFRALCERLGFRRWLDDMETPLSAPALEVITVLDGEQLDALREALAAASLFALDTETDGLDPQQARLVGLSFAVDAGRGWYLPVGHDYMGAPAQLGLDAVREALAGILADASIAKVGQHSKFDDHILRRHGLPVCGWGYDTMLESYVLNATATRHDMDSLAGHYLSRSTIKFEAVAGKGRKQLTFNQVDLDTAAPYAAEDAEITLALHQTLWPRIAADEKLKTVYETIEQPLVSVLADIERRGVLLASDQLARASTEFATRMHEIEQQAHALAGGEFNLNSPAQLKTILFEQLELPVLRKTPKGQPSTAEDVLADLADQHELPRMILDYRMLAKLRSTYTEKLPEAINPQTGRVHTSYHQAVAATGRLSSADPNLQNIPIRSPEGRRIRQAFVAPPGCCLLSLDYSQIELRLMAHMSGDDSLLRAFRDGRDIHRATAAEVFGLDPDAVPDAQRRAAKAINFGLIYGISAFGQAQDYMDLFFARYPGVQDYMTRCREQARDSGYVETLYGRRLYLPEIGASNQQRRQAAERVAINAPLQGTAADIIKLAMIRIADELGDRDECRMILQVHDELVFELAEDGAEARARRLAEQMETVATLDVPLKVDWGLGPDWDTAH